MGNLFKGGSWALLFLASVVGAPASYADSWLDHVHVNGQVRLFTGPSESAHAPFSELIAGASREVEMEMYHLVDPEVLASLEGAVKRGLKVEVIVDGKSAARGNQGRIVEELERDGVTVVRSSPKFSITHTKALIVDSQSGGQSAIISSMNLTAHPEVRRDYGVVIEDRDLIREMESVFDTDVGNARDRTGLTPEISDPRLLWSPVNSASKLHDLVASAKTSVVAVAENVLDKDLIDDLIEASRRGVAVWVMSPACPLGQKPSGNYQSSLRLKAGGVRVRQMPDPATPETPYLHGKMMVVDDKAYIGSINFSHNSLHMARELGIVLDDTGTVAGLKAAFTQDFGHAVEIPDTVYSCQSAFTDEGDSDQQ